MSDSEVLQRLAEALRKPGMPSQLAISREIDVDQPLISRACRHQLRRVTGRVQRLCDYAERKAAELDARKQAVVSRSKSGPSHSSEALEDCRKYLRDGCDPTLLRDQLKVLRRAQGMP